MLCARWLFYHFISNAGSWNNWKGAWKKALSDFWSIAILCFQITLYLLEKIRENLTLQKDSLRTLFHAPLQLLYNGTSMEQSAFLWTSLCTQWTILTHTLFFYFQSIVDSPYLLEPLIDRIASEQSAEVKLQLLTATMKLFFKKPPECQHMLGRLLKFCVGEFNSLF